MTTRHGIYYPPVRYGRHPSPSERKGRLPWDDVVIVAILVVAMWAIFHPEIGL